MQKLSLQTHEHRDEYWFVTSGVGVATVEDSRVELYAGATLQVLRGEKHRLESFGGNLVLIEVQTGSYLGEDDIVRYEDDYGRAADATQS
jgi:mannose-1-phosphate guanylyltransferase